MGVQNRLGEEISGEAKIAAETFMSARAAYSEAQTDYKTAKDALLKAFNETETRYLEIDGYRISLEDKLSCKKIKLE